MNSGSHSSSPFQPEKFSRIEYTGAEVALLGLGGVSTAALLLFLVSTF